MMWFYNYIDMIRQENMEELQVLKLFFRNLESYWQSFFLKHEEDLMCGYFGFSSC